MKMCEMCEIDLPITWFPIRRQNGKKRRLGYCEHCNRAYHRINYAQNAEQRTRDNRTRYYKTRYGLTLEDVDAMFDAQGGRCAICGTEAPGDRYKKFHVDHCHTTGKVRGMLCGQCNRGIGALGDDPDRVQRAADYLKLHDAVSLTP